MNKLITDIASKLFNNSEQQLTVVFDNDGFLLNDDVRYALAHVSGREIVSGSSLDLRILREIELRRFPEKKYLFISTEDFSPLDDIAIESDIIRFSIARFFPRYRFECNNIYKFRRGVNCIKIDE